MDERDLDALRRDFPGWRYGSLCTTVATRAGPPRKITASRNGVILAAETVHELRQKLHLEEKHKPQGT